MSFLVNTLSRADFLKTTYEAADKWNKTESNLDRVAVASKWVAEISGGLAVGAVVKSGGAAIRIFKPAIRLGYAVSGKLDQWEKIAAFFAFVEGLGIGSFIDFVNSINIGGKLYDFLHPENSSLENTRKYFGDAKSIRSPIILDLDNDGIETTSQATGAYFDHQTDGFAERTGWAGADDGLLVRDLNGNGTIDSGQELFGSETRLANNTKAPNGFEALKQLDTNNDGQLNAQDTAYNDLRIWQDTDGDGYSQAQELHTLQELGIQSIATAYTTGTATDPQGNQHQQLGSYTTTAGQTRAATDVWFQADPTYSIATEWLDIPDAIAVLPDATGYGKVRDLHQAMARDPGGALQQLVTQFTQATNASQREDILTSLIYHWTGVQNIDPKSRAARFICGNVIGDARKLEALEEFMGQEWVGVWCWGTRDPNPHGRAAPVLLKAWDQLKELIGSQLMAQSHLKPMFDRITYTWDDAGRFPSNDSFWEKRA